MKFRHLAVAASSILALVILLEVVAYIGLQVREMTKPNVSDVHKKLLARDGIDARDQYRELKSVYNDLVTLEPYRWYAIPRAFQGNHISTDAYGFRNSMGQTLYSQSKRIGFFGGSTMFGITSKLAHTIPSLVAEALKPELAQTFNFGIGAYSTSSELMTFVEVSRLKHYDIKYAIFYDGVNELGRYIEKLQDHQSNPIYEAIGYPYVASLRPAASDFSKSTGGLQVQYQPALVQIWKQIELRFNRSKNINYILSDDDIERHAEIIYRIYANNVLDIDAIAKSRGIQAIFLWQPSLFSIRDRQLTESERDILKSEAIAKKLSDSLNTRVRRGNELRRIKFFDLSAEFDKLSSEEHFYDCCHVDADGNRLIAMRIVDILRQFLPSDYFQVIGSRTLQ